MKNLLLTGVAVLLLATGPSHSDKVKTYNEYERGLPKLQMWACDNIRIPLIRTESNNNIINNLVWGNDTFSFMNSQLYRKYGLNYLPCARLKPGINGVVCWKPDGTKNTNWENAWVPGAWCERKLGEWR